MENNLESYWTQPLGVAVFDREEDGLTGDVYVTQYMEYPVCGCTTRTLKFEQDSKFNLSERRGSISNYFRIESSNNIIKITYVQHKGVTSKYMQTLHYQSDEIKYLFSGIQAYV